MVAVDRRISVLAGDALIFVDVETLFENEGTMVRGGRFSTTLWEGNGSPGGESCCSSAGFHRRSYSGTLLKGLATNNYSQQKEDFYDSKSRRKQKEPRWYTLGRVCLGVFVLFLVFFVGRRIFSVGPSVRYYRSDAISKRIESGLDRLKVFPMHRGEDEAEKEPEWDKLPSLQIPSTVHFMYEGSDDLKKREGLYKELQKENPGWEIRTYNMDLMEMHVKAWFPAFIETFTSLENDKERHNVFRYLLVLKFGGISCCGLYDGRPESLNFSSILTYEDRFVSVWNPTYRSASAALNSCRVRQRSIRNDFIASVERHPILVDVYNQIGSMKDKTYSHVELLNTLERTGEGVLTDTVLSYALHGSFHEEIRLLPSKMFSKDRQSRCNAPWKLLEQTGGAAREENVAYPAQLEISEWFSRNEHDEDIVAETVALLERVAQKEAQYTLVPVSAKFSPPFDVMTHAAGVGEWHAGSDVSAALLAYGTWQPSVRPNRGPALVDIILGSMNAKRNSGVLIDVGAGYGLASLAAASRGHHVIAFEVGSKSLEAFKESVDRNSFGEQVTVHEYPLGSSTQDGETVCLRVSESTMAMDSDWGRMQQRGYGLPLFTNKTNDSCLIRTTRRAGHLVSGNDGINALKVSADGWGGHVIDGFLPLLKPTRDRPKLISIEWNPEMYKKAGYSEPLKVLEQLHSLGYQGISHSGYICDERWRTLTYNMEKRRDFDDSKSESLRQPTWCRIERDEFQVLMKLGELSKTIETILFIDTIPL